MFIVEKGDFQPAMLDYRSVSPPFRVTKPGGESNRLMGFLCFGAPISPYKKTIGSGPTLQEKMHSKKIKGQLGVPMVFIVVSRDSWGL